MMAIRGLAESHHFYVPYVEQYVVSILPLESLLSFLFPFLAFIEEFFLYGY